MFDQWERHRACCNQVLEAAIGALGALTGQRKENGEYICKVKGVAVAVAGTSFTYFTIGECVYRRYAPCFVSAVDKLGETE